MKSQIFHIAILFILLIYIAILYHMFYFAKSLESFTSNIQQCDSVTASNYSQSSSSIFMRQLSTMPLITSPASIATKPPPSTTSEKRPGSDCIQGDFAAFIKGPSSPPWPSNFRKVVSHFDWVIYEFYTKVFGFKPRSKVDSIIRETHFLPLVDAPFTGMGDGPGPDAAVAGWPVIFLQAEFMQQTWIDKNEKFWKLTVGHELFHSYQLHFYDFRMCGNKD